MRIDVPREIKCREQRIALVPSGAAALVHRGHEVMVERGAGEGAGFLDAEYVSAGATIVPAAALVFACDLVVKVKELMPQELALLRTGTVVFGFAQLARDPALVSAVVAARITIIGYEAVVAGDGSRPLLAPMSRIAGQLAPLIGARLLLADMGGSGTVLGGVAGTEDGHVVVIGAGAAGGAAVATAAGLGCRVTVLARTRERLAALETRHGTRIATDICTSDALARTLPGADLVVGAVLVAGRLSPMLIDRAMLRSMRRGSVFVDIGIDQGGIAATSRMTSIAAPTYVEEGIIHYAVPNIPALAPRTATLALTRATLPYVLALAVGIDDALRADSGLQSGVQVADGKIVHSAVGAQARGPLAQARA